MARREQVLLPGVDRHGSRYRARMRFPAVGRVQETRPTADEANALILEWKKLKAQGLLPEKGSADILLRDAAAGLLERKEKTPKKGGKPRSPETIRWWSRILKPCTTGLLAELSVARLKRARVEDWFYPRAIEVPKTGNDELTGLKATLRFAEGRGVAVDRSIFEIESLPYSVRPRHSLTVDQLKFFLPYPSRDARPVVDLCSTAGLRIGEALSLDIDQVNFDARTIFIPAGKNKERRDKIIDLTDEETRLLRVAREAARVPGEQAVFVTGRGTRWKYTSFRQDYWDPAVRAASADWREVQGLSEDDETPFEWCLRDEPDDLRRKENGEPVWDHLLIHDLRSTAVTMMRDAGLSREQAAARVGHSDPELIDRIYDQGDRRIRSGVRRALDEVAPRGLGEGARARLAENAPPDTPGIGPKS